MTTTATVTVPQRSRVDRTRTTALVAGALYLITFVASIPAALFLLTPVLTNPNYIVSAGTDTGVVWGCVLDVVTALAGIGTAVALFPVVKRQNEALALGFVTSRVIEAAIILIGVVSLLAVVTLHQNVTGGAGADATTLVTAGKSLVAVRDRTFVLGPMMMAAFNALLLGTLMYRSRLVPRVIPGMGLIGAPLLLAATTATLFGYLQPFSLWSSIATLPVAAWEFSLGVYLVVKGFKPAPITASSGS